VRNLKLDDELCAGHRPKAGRQAGLRPLQRPRQDCQRRRRQAWSRCVSKPPS